MTTNKHRALLAALLLVVVLPASGVAASPGTHAATQSGESVRSLACGNTVVHDAYRFNNETIAAAKNGSARSTVSNTEVRVEQSTGFVRVNGTNPNGYCVTFVVRISDEIVSPAELGTVEATKANETAEWHAIRDFNRSETYTEVTFTLPPGSTATFAPSRARVQSLSWTSSVEKQAGSLLGSVKSLDIPFFGDGSLEQQKYTFSPENNSTTIITVSLENKTDGRTIKDWQALYRTPGGSWAPINKDSEEPVFYRKLDKHHIQFIFNNPDAEVRFVANPSFTNKASHQLKSYMAGLDAIQDVFNVTLTVSPRLDLSALQGTEVLT